MTAEIIIIKMHGEVRYVKTSHNMDMEYIVLDHDQEIHGICPGCGNDGQGQILLGFPCDHCAYDDDWTIQDIIENRRCDECGGLMDVINFTDDGELRRVCDDCKESED